MTYKKFFEKYCDGTWEVQDDGGVTSKEFDQFSRDFKSALKEICGRDWEVTKYSKGHYFVSTFLRNRSNPEKFLYLNISDIRHFPNWHTSILYRTAENEKDYRGGTNQYSSLENLKDALERENRIICAELAESIENVSDDASISRAQVQEAEEERDRIARPMLTGARSGLYTAFKTFGEKGVFELNGQKVDMADGRLTETGWKQLEAAMEIYRSKKFETFRYVLIDRKSGEVRDQLAISSHMPNLCVISLPENETVLQVKRHAERLDCLVTVCHNHPSGNTEESPLDRTLTQKLEELLQDRFAGHIILDHGNFNLYTSKDGWNTVKTIPETGLDPLELEKKPDWANAYIGKTVDLLGVAGKIDGGESWNDGYVPIVFINTEKQVSAIQYYEKDFFKDSPEKVRGELIESALDAGTAAAFPVVTNSLWGKFSQSEREEFAECLKNHVENNAFMDAVIGGMTVTEKYSIKPGESYYNTFKERLEKNIEVQSTWERGIDKAPVSESEPMKVAEKNEPPEPEPHNDGDNKNAATQKLNRIVNEVFFTLTESEKSEGLTEETKERRYELWFKPMVDDIQADVASGNPEVIKLIGDFSEDKSSYKSDNPFYSEDDSYNHAVKQKLLPALYEKVQDRIKAGFDETKTPYIQLGFSESSDFGPDGKVYALKEFNEILTEADSTFHNRRDYAIKKYGSADKYWELAEAGKIPEEDKGISFGYDKTEFKIFNIPNSANPDAPYTYEPGRYDIGDGDGSVFDYIRETCSHDAITEGMNRLEEEMFFPHIADSQKLFVERAVSSVAKTLHENAEKVREEVVKANELYGKTHSQILIDRSEWDGAEKSQETAVGLVRKAYEDAAKDFFWRVLNEYPFAPSSSKNSEFMKYIASSAKKMIIEELYRPTREYYKAMNKGERYEIDWDVQHKVWSALPHPVNLDDYTRDLLWSVAEERGISVSETNEAEKAKKPTEITEPQTVFQLKYLTAEDIELLRDWGESEDRDIVQIDSFIDYGEMRDENGKKLTFKKAVKLLGRNEIISGMERASFHRTAYREANGHSVSFSTKYDEVEQLVKYDEMSGDGRIELSLLGVNEKIDKTVSLETGEENTMTENKVDEYAKKVKEYKDALRLAYNSGSFGSNKRGQLEKLRTELGLSDEENKAFEKPYLLAKKAQDEGKTLHFNEICECHHMGLCDESNGSLEWETIDHSDIEYLEIGGTYIEKCSGGGYGTKSAFISIGESIESLYAEYGEEHFPEEAVKDGKAVLFDRSVPSVQRLIDGYIKTRFNVMSPLEIEEEYTASLGEEGDGLSAFLKQVEDKEFYDLDWSGEVNQINNLIHDFDDVDLYTFKPPFKLNQDIQLVAWDERDHPVIQEIDTENGFINLLHDLHSRFNGNGNYEGEILALENLITSFAKGKNRERYLQSVHTFEDDREKMEDFFHIPKDEFLASYSYLDEDEYDATALKVNEKYRLKEPVHADLHLGDLFNGVISEDEKRDGSETVVLSGGNTIERSGSAQEGFYFDMRNKSDGAYLAFDGMKAEKIAEINGVSYFTNNDDRMDWQGEVFSLNDDEIRLAFDSQGQGLLSRGAEKSEYKTVFLSSDVAKSVIFDDEVIYDKENGTVDFYAWATDELMEQFVPSEKRLGVEDSENEFYFYFSYKDEQNVSLHLGYYDKDDKKVYETFNISPESEGYDRLKELMDDYAMKTDGKHIEDYKVLDGLEALGYAELSQIVNASTAPLFSDEMARIVIGQYKEQGIPLYKNGGNELFVYHKNYDDPQREYEEFPVEKCRLYDVIKNFIEEYDHNLASGGKKGDDMLESFKKIRDSLGSEEKGILDTKYSPVSVDSLENFINIAELDSFDSEMAEECALTFVNNKIPLVCDELGNIYQRNIGDSRTETEADLEMVNPSAVIDFYKNDLERQASFASEDWYAEHKHRIDTLNDIEDYLVEIENSVPLTTENAHILSDYVNHNKEEFGKAFTKTNGNIPAFEDMSVQLAEDIIETLEADDYYVRYDEKEKQFFIYDQQSADNSLFEKADASTLVSKAGDITEGWLRDDTTDHENEICGRLEKFLYPTENYLPVELTVDMNVPQSLKKNWVGKNSSLDNLSEGISNFYSEIKDTVLNVFRTKAETEHALLEESENRIVLTVKTRLTVKDSFTYEELQTEAEQGAIESVLSQTIGTALQEHFKDYIANDANGLPEKITFNSIKAEKPAAERTWEEIGADWNERDFADARNRAKDILKEQSESYTERELKEETVYQLLYDFIEAASDLPDEELSFNSSVLEEMSEKYVSNELRLEAAQNYFDAKRQERAKIRVKEAAIYTPEQKCYERYVEVWKLDHVFEEGVSEPASFSEFLDNEYSDADIMKEYLSESLFKEYADGIKESLKNKVGQGNELTLEEATNLSAALSLLDKGSKRPTGEQIITGLEDGWDFDDVCNGYMQAASDDLPKGVLVIMRIDDMMLFDDDHEAAIQAEKDGIKLIPKEELDFELDEDGEPDERSHYDYIDTPENRKLLQEAGLLRRTGIGDYVTLDLKALSQSEKYLRTGFDIDSESVVGGTTEWLENTSNRIKFTREDGEIYLDLIDEAGTVLAWNGDEVLVSEHKDGMYKLIADEDSEMPHTFYLSDADFEIATGKVSFSQLMDEQNRQLSEKIYEWLVEQSYESERFDFDMVRIRNDVANMAAIDFIRHLSEQDLSAYQDDTALSEFFSKEMRENNLLVVSDDTEELEPISSFAKVLLHNNYLQNQVRNFASSISRLEQNKKISLLEEAKDLISDFCFNEYTSTPDFSDLRNVGIAYTDYFDPETRKEYPIQVSVNLMEPSITATFDGKELWKDDNYEDLQDFVATGLGNLDFDSLVSVADYDIDAIIKGEPSSIKSETTADEEIGTVVELDGRQMNLLADYLTTKQTNGNQQLESAVHKIVREADHAEPSDETSASVELTDGELHSLKTILESERPGMKHGGFTILKDVLFSIEDFPSKEKQSVPSNGNCLGWEDEIEAWLNKNFYREGEYFNGSKTMGKYSYTLSPSVAKPITDSELGLFENKDEPPEEILNRIKDTKFDEERDTKIADIVSELQEYMRGSYDARLSYGDIQDYLFGDEKLQVLQPTNEEWLLLEPKETIERLAKAGIRLDGIQQNEKQKEDEMENNGESTERKPMPVYAYSPFGYEGAIVQMETELRRGIPAYDIVGISDGAVRETRERIRAAFRNSDLDFPKERVLQSASPADLKKEGYMDLAMAVSILSQTEDYIKEPVMVLGELELSGKVRPVRGSTAAVTNAINAGIRNIVCDPQTAKEIEGIKGIRILEVENLAEANAGLRSLENFRKIGLTSIPSQSDEVEFSTENDGELPGAVQGNYETVRAMEIAAAGKHNILITGAPGCGKTILNQELLPKITPKLTEEESLSKQRIWSIAGLYSPKGDTRTAAFRMPHQTASLEGMYGGGLQCRPGEISLAHNGVLFLDEAAEFKSSVLQMLRTPLETRNFTLSRAGRSTVYPADFQLSLAMNPCPCGKYGVKDKLCLDSAKSIDQYWNKVSGPLLDRIEIKNFMQKDENDTRKTTLKEMRERIATAIKIQRERGAYNSHLNPQQVAQYCKISDGDRKLLEDFAERFDISQRNIANTLKVALTVANMDGRAQIRTNDLREAMEMTAPIFNKPREYHFDPAFPNGKSQADDLTDLIREDITSAIESIDESIKINGMRFYQPPEDDGKLHLAVEYEADNWREDGLFNALSEERFTLYGREVDVNPITPNKSGTLDEYIKTVEGANKIIAENDRELKARDEMKKNISFFVTETQEFRSEMIETDLTAREAFKLAAEKNKNSPGEYGVGAYSPDNISLNFKPVRHGDGLFYWIVPDARNPAVSEIDMTLLEQRPDDFVLNEVKRQLEEARDYYAKEAEQTREDSTARAKESSRAQSLVHSTKGTEITSDDLKYAKLFLPKGQYSLVLQNTQGEEGEHFKQIIKGIAEKARSIEGKSEIVDEEGKHPLAFKYTFPNNTKFYISEWNGDDEVFGYTVLKGDTQMSEWGYSSLSEIRDLAVKDRSGFPVTTEMTFYGLEPTVEKMAASDFPELARDMDEERKSREEEMIQEFSRELNEAIHEKNLEPTTENIVLASYHVMQSMDSSGKKELISLMEKCGCTDEAKSNEFLAAVKDYGTADGKARIKQALENLTKKNETAPQVEDEPEAGM